MNYTPTLADAASDFYRCANIAFSTKNFENKSFRVFFRNGQNILRGNKSRIRIEKFNSVNECIRKSKDKSLSLEKRCGQLVTAYVLLKNYYYVQYTTLNDTPEVEAY